MRWPAALLSAMLIYAIVYYAAPNVEIRHWKYITPGAVFGVALWILASAGFFVYVSGFSLVLGYIRRVRRCRNPAHLVVAHKLVLLFGAELNVVVDQRRAPNLPRGYDGPVLPPKEPAGA